MSAEDTRVRALEGDATARRSDATREEGLSPKRPRRSRWSRVEGGAGSSDEAAMSRGRGDVRSVPNARAVPVTRGGGAPGGGAFHGTPTKQRTEVNSASPTASHPGAAGIGSTLTEALVPPSGVPPSAVIAPDVSLNTETIPSPDWIELRVPWNTPESSSTQQPRLPVDQLPSYAQPAFRGFEHLNSVQTVVYERLRHSDDNFLVCAPTGTGKTYVALLAILRCFFETCGGVHRRFQCIYVAPMRALVAEVRATLSKRLAYTGLQVAELTGEKPLSAAQYRSTQVVVTTPEKWDVLTRRANERGIFRRVRLVVVDEVHLIGDPERGPVLERVLARLLAEADVRTYPLQIIGLSATLPNSRDVALFLRARLAENVFALSNAHRPCRLEQRYFAVRERADLLGHARRRQLMNRIAWQVLEQHALTQRHQTIVFVHERTDTLRTARAFAEQLRAASARLVDDADTVAALRAASIAIGNPELRQLLPLGIAVHHAGLARTDRDAVESLFLQNRIRVLVSTATLAWGVNLPARTVIIKGTKYFSAAQDRYVELSPLDVTQMIGRAGRPPFDSCGDGIIITSERELSRYVALVNGQTPLESHLLSALPESLLAEIAAGAVVSAAEAADWLTHTFLYVRLLRHPVAYGVHAEEVPPGDEQLLAPRQRWCQQALQRLEAGGLIRRSSSVEVEATERGRLVALFYLPLDAAEQYGQHLHDACTAPDVLHALAVAPPEMRLMRTVRSPEQTAMAQLAANVRLPILYPETDTKVSALVQAHIGGVDLWKTAAVQDASVVLENTERLLASMHAFCVMRRWARSALECLRLLRQFRQRDWLAHLTPAPSRGIDHRLLPRSDSRVAADAGRDANTSAAPDVPTEDRWMAASIYPLAPQWAAVQVTMRVPPELAGALPASAWISAESADGQRLFAAHRVSLRAALTAHVLGVYLGDAPAQPFLLVRLAYEDAPLAEQVSALPVWSMRWPDAARAVTSECSEVASPALGDDRRFDAVIERLLAAATARLLWMFPAGPTREACVMACAAHRDAARHLVYVSPEAESRRRLRHRLSERGMDVVELSGVIAEDVQMLSQLAASHGNVLIAAPSALERVLRSSAARAHWDPRCWLVCDAVDEIAADPTYEALLSRPHSGPQLLLCAPVADASALRQWLRLSEQQVLGDAPESTRARVPAMVCGLHGSSLCPEVVARRFLLDAERVTVAAGALHVCVVGRDARGYARELALRAPHRTEPTAPDDASRLCKRSGVTFWDASLGERERHSVATCPDVRMLVLEAEQAAALETLQRPIALGYLVVDRAADAGAAHRDPLLDDVRRAQHLMWQCRVQFIALVHRSQQAVFQHFLARPLPLRAPSSSDLDEWVHSQVCDGSLRCPDDVARLVRQRLVFHLACNNPQAHGFAPSADEGIIAAALQAEVQASLQRLQQQYGCVIRDRKDGALLEVTALNVVAASCGLRPRTVATMARQCPVPLLATDEVRVLHLAEAAAAEVDTETLTAWMRRLERSARPSPSGRHAEQAPQDNDRQSRDARVAFVSVLLQQMLNDRVAEVNAVAREALPSLLPPCCNILRGAVEMAAGQGSLQQCAEAIRFLQRFHQAAMRAITAGNMSPAAPYALQRSDRPPGSERTTLANAVSVVKHRRESALGDSIPTPPLAVECVNTQGDDGCVHLRIRGARAALEALGGSKSNASSMWWIAVHVADGDALLGVQQIYTDDQVAEARVAVDWALLPADRRMSIHLFNEFYDTLELSSVCALPTTAS
ncbi:hypothetical protein CDCA_CDCA08G2399 [Cyanidium caldarium]|uniref:Uncharacterized protein n=1 Tax=Cyanidium caldarium TaxID=2771 RepID=A0AAV9IW66_CYACA|nr:hypothetical protein CDCA_CDCA08G2399 [Cyanidium caldarium]